MSREFAFRWSWVEERNVQGLKFLMVCVGSIWKSKKRPGDFVGCNLEWTFAALAKLTARDLSDKANLTEGGGYSGIHVVCALCAYAPGLQVLSQLQSAPQKQTGWPRGSMIPTSPPLHLHGVEARGIEVSTFYQRVYVMIPPSICLPKCLTRCSRCSHEVCWNASM